MLWEVEAAEEGIKLGAFLRRHGVSMTLVRRLKYQPEGLLCNGLRARTNQRLVAGDCVGVTLAEEGCSAEPQDIPLRVAYESAHAWVADKPAGMLTHPVGTRQRDTLANAYCGLMRSRGQSAVFRPVGRLDADTSGLVLCALNPFAAPFLAKTTQKTYLALLSGRLDAAAGEIDAPLAASPGSAVLQRVHPAGRPSRTVYRRLAQTQSATLVAATPLTGRTHQIRAHFAYLGHPLLGDALYGGDVSLLERQALHCARLSFVEPEAGPVELESPLPDDMVTTLVTLGVDPHTCQKFDRIV